MRLQARQDVVAHLAATLVASSTSPDGWTTSYLDDTTGEQWRRVYLGSEQHGGGLPIFVKEPMPGVAELLDIAAESSDPAEIAASAWLLAEMDQEGGYKERLVSIAEEAARRDDQSRAALLVGWGCLNDEMNLRPALGKHFDEVTKDHEYFRNLAARARKLLPPRGKTPA